MAIPNWIKVEQTTPDKPEVVQMAAALRLDQDAVVGKLVRLWIWADQNSVNGSAIPVTRAFIDRLVNKRGFANAAGIVGWLAGEDGALVFSNFERHNGETGKQRAQSNRRVAEMRHREAEASRLETNGKRESNAGSVTFPLQKRIPEEEEDQNPLSPPQAGEGAASPAPSKPAESNQLRKRRWGRGRLPDLKTLRENLAELRSAIAELRFPGGCAHERRPEEMSPDKRDRLAKLRGESAELEKLIEDVRAELGSRRSAKREEIT